MNKNWLTKNDNKKLILFFNGWAMESVAIKHLTPNNYDLVEFNDYSTIDFDENEYVEYKEITVVAWSLGVWVASYILGKSNLTIKKAIAINGTLNPVHLNEGIHPTIFEGTINGWNEQNRTRFLMRTIGGRKEFVSHMSKFGNRSVKNQKKELEDLYNRINESMPLVLKFDTALIGTKDAIFTPKNQQNYWQGKTNCKYIEMPHYPFLKLSAWGDIIEI